MNEMLLRWLMTLDEASLRERLLIFLTTVGILFTLWSNLLISPLDEEQKQARNDFNSANQTMASAKVDIAKILARAKDDPNAKDRETLERYSKELANVRAKIQNAVSGLIRPGQMAQALEDVLQKSGSLRLVGLKNLGSRELLEPQKNDSGDDNKSAEETHRPRAITLYRHGLQLVFEGDYNETLKYLRNINELEWSIYWDSIDISMEDYPQARITIVVHTLSYQEGWIDV